MNSEEQEKVIEEFKAKLAEIKAETDKQKDDQAEKKN